MEKSKNTHAAAPASLRLKRWLRVGRPAVLRLISMTIAVVVIFSFGSVAWYSANQDAEPNDVALKAGSMPFELAVYGTNVGALSYKQSGTPASPIYTSSEIYDKASSGSTARQLTSGASMEVSEQEYRVTDDENMMIKWRLSDAYNDRGLGPNSQGILTFYIIPKTTGTLDVSFTIHMEGYTSVQEKNTNGSYDVTSVEPVGDGSPEDAQDALRYLDGHILFFSGRENLESDSNKQPVYSYTGFLDGNEFTLSEIKGETVSATEGVPIEVNIYWIWSNTFGQMVFSSEQNANLTPIGYNDITRTKLQEYILNHITSVFDDIAEAEARGKLAVESEDEYVFDVDTVKTGTNYADLTLGYNKADQKIGMNIDYILLVLDAH